MRPDGNSLRRTFSSSLNQGLIASHEQFSIDDLPLTISKQPISAHKDFGRQIMPSKYAKLAANQKRVSFDDSPQFNYEAPRTSLDGRPSVDAPGRTPRYSRDGSDDEIDNLLAEDPLYEEKDTQKNKTRSGARLSRKKRRVLIFGIISMLLCVCAAVAVFSVKVHGRDHVATDAKTFDKAQSDAAAIQEVSGLTEVPTLIGNLPLSSEEVMPKPLNNHVSDGAVISVPETKIDWNNEEEDRKTYEAAAALDKESESNAMSNNPPELSSEAIEQVHNVAAPLGEANTAVVDSASKITSHKDAMEGLRVTVSDIMAWFNAKWRDMLGNDAKSGEVIY